MYLCLQQNSEKCISMMDRDEGRMLFLGAPHGTGKTLSTLVKLSSEGKIALATDCS